MFYNRGTIGVYDLTVGDSCHLYLGKTGNTKRSGFISTIGTFDFDVLTVAAGGEVTATSDLVGDNNEVKLAVSILRKVHKNKDTASYVWGPIIGSLANHVF